MYDRSDIDTVQYLHHAPFSSAKKDHRAPSNDDRNKGSAEEREKKSKGGKMQQILACQV
jgi:hypothetical protein